MRAPAASAAGASVQSVPTNLTRHSSITEIKENFSNFIDSVAISARPKSEGFPLSLRFGFDKMEESKGREVQAERSYVMEDDDDDDDAVVVYEETELKSSTNSGAFTASPRESGSTANLISSPLRSESSTTTVSQNKCETLMKIFWSGRVHELRSFSSREWRDCRTAGAVKGTFGKT